MFSCHSLPIVDRIYNSLRVFAQVLTSSFSMSDNKISKTLKVDFSSAVVCMVLIIPLISSFPSLFPRFFGSIIRTLATLVITVIFVLHCFFSSLSRSKYFSIFPHSFVFTLEQQRRLDDNFFFLFFPLVLCDPFVS